MKLKKWNIVLIVLSFGLLLGYLFWQEDVRKIAHMLADARPLWLVCALGLMVLYWLLEAVILHLVSRKLYDRQRFDSTFRTSMVGQFFNCVTPFASGGQPMQAVQMVKGGMPLGQATSALLIKFIIYQATLTLYSLVMLVFCFGYFAERIPGFGRLILLGFLVSAAVLAGLLCLGLFHRLTMWLCTRVVRLLARLHIVKDEQEKIAYVEQESRSFHESFVLMRKEIPTMVWMVGLSAVQLTVFFLIPSCLFATFGVVNIDAPLVLSAQTFVTLISSFIPLPGAMLGAEFSFASLFNILVADTGIINMVMTLWRMLTFYLPIVVGMFFVFRLRGDAPPDASE